MKTLDESLLRTGQTFLVCSGNPSFFAQAITEFQMAQYPKDVAKFHHAGKLFKSAGEWWVCEEKRITGVGNTKLSEYLAIDANTYMIREPNYMDMTKENQFAEAFVNDVNDGFYDVLGIFQLAYMFTMYKITGKAEWVGPTNNKKNYVCSVRCAKWDNDILGLYPEWYKMAPADYVVTQYYKTIITL